MLSAVLKVLLFLQTARELIEVSGLKCHDCGWPNAKEGQTEDCHAPTTNSSKECRHYDELVKAYCYIWIKLSLEKDKILDIDRGCYTYTATMTDEKLRSEHDGTRIVAPQCNNDMTPPRFYKGPGWDAYRQDCFCKNDDCNSVTLPT